MITVNWTDYLDRFGPEHDEPLLDLALTREGEHALEMAEALAAEQAEVEDIGFVVNLPCDHTHRDVVFDDLPVDDEDQVVVCVACGAEHAVEGWAA